MTNRVTKAGSAFAPTDDPAVAVSVIVENGGHQGDATASASVAAPMAAMSDQAGYAGLERQRVVALSAAAFVLAGEDQLDLVGAADVEFVGDQGLEAPCRPTSPRAGGALEECRDGDLRQARSVVQHRGEQPGRRG